MKLKYLGNNPVHCLMEDGTTKTLYKNMVVEKVKVLPEPGAEYCVIYKEPKAAVDKKSQTKKKKVKKNGT